jgi:hypothetical protein
MYDPYDTLHIREDNFIINDPCLPIKLLFSLFFKKINVLYTLEV